MYLESRGNVHPAEAVFIHPIAYFRLRIITLLGAYCLLPIPEENCKTEEVLLSDEDAKEMQFLRQVSFDSKPMSGENSIRK